MKGVSLVTKKGKVRKVSQTYYGSKVRSGVYRERSSRGIPTKKLIFDFDSDEGKFNIINLKNQNLIEQQLQDGTLVCSYRYAKCATEADKKLFRDLVKEKTNLSSSFMLDGMREVIEDGLFRFDVEFPIRDFSALVTVEPTSSKNTIIRTLGLMLLDLVSEDGYTVYENFELMKKTFSEVKFNKEPALKALQVSKRYRHLNERQLELLVEEFEENLDSFRKGKQALDQFQMKFLTPSEARTGIYDFLKFTNEDLVRIYECLDRKPKALVYDDFFTSGSTFAEAARVLRTVKSKLEIVFFALVNQR